MHATAAGTAATAITATVTACQSISNPTTISLQPKNFLFPASTSQAPATDPGMKSPDSSHPSRRQGAFVLFTSDFALDRRLVFTLNSPCRSLPTILESKYRRAPLLSLSVSSRRPSLAAYACHQGSQSAPPRHSPSLHIRGSLGPHLLIFRSLLMEYSLHDLRFFRQLPCFRLNERLPLRPTYDPGHPESTSIRHPT